MFNNVIDQTNINKYQSHFFEIVTRTSIIGFSSILCLSVIAGIGLYDSLLVALVVGTQITSGAMIWLLLRRNCVVTMPELLGMGLAIGSIASTGVSQILRTTPVHGIGWALPLLLVVVASAKSSIRTPSAFIDKIPRFDGAIIATAILFALSYWWVWILPVALFPLFFYFLLSDPRSWFSSLRVRLKFLIAVATGTTLFAIAIWIRNSNLSWWIFSHDQTFLEGIATSVNIWGPQENIHAVGIPDSYHWFVLAWSGMTTNAAGLAPLIVITKVLPLCAFLGAVPLIWACTRQLTKISYSPVIALLLFVLGSNYLNLQPIRFTNSPTFIFSMMWLLAFVFTFVECLRGQMQFGLGVLTLLFVANFGGKASNGPILLSGVLFCALINFLFLRNRSRYRFLNWSSFLLIISSIVIYLLLYKSQSIIGDGNILRIDIASVASDLGAARQNSLFLTKILMTMSIIAICSPIFLISSPLLLGRSSRKQPELYFFFGISLSGILLTSIFGHSGASELYFLLGAVAVAPVIAGYAIPLYTENTKNFYFEKKLYLIFAVTSIYTICTFFLWRFFAKNTNAQEMYYAQKIGIAFSVIVILIFLPIIFFRESIQSPFNRDAKTFRRLSRLVILMTVLLTLGVIHQYDAVIRFVNSSNRDPNDSNLLQGSTGELAALTWLRENSNVNDILATNRFCIPLSDSCDAKWFLVSAITHRRMLIEGYNRGTDDVSQDERLPEWAKALSQPLWAQQRLLHSLGFAEFPNISDYEYLRSNSVAWMVVDHTAQFSGTRSWHPFAEVAFQNQDMSVLRLKQTP